MTSPSSAAPARHRSSRPGIAAEVITLLDSMNRRWVPHLLYLLSQGEARFTDLVEALPGISRRALSERLRELADEGLLVRNVEPGPPTVICYRLTATGAQTLADVAAAVTPRDAGAADSRPGPMSGAPARGTASTLSSSAVRNDVRLVAPTTCLIPSPPSPFVGRRAALHDLGPMLAANSLVEVTGPAGIGKTALVAQWAHISASKFPDGQLYAKLSAGTEEILGRFLRALGVPPDAVPQQTDLRAEMFGRLIAERRMLIVLDDAHTYPASALTAAVGTTPTLVIGQLIADTGAGQTPGPPRLVVSSLDRHEAQMLLRALVGKRLDDESEAGWALAELCRTPAVAQAVAAILAADPMLPVGALLERCISQDPSPLVRARSGATDL